MICRLCLKDDIETISIFGEVGLELNIADVLQKHFWFKPKEDDPISTGICDSCCLSVMNFHEFYMTIQESHQLLAERFSLKLNPSESKRPSFDDSEIDAADVKDFVDSENAVMLPVVESIVPDELASDVTKLPDEYDEALIVDVNCAKLSDEKDLFEDVDDGVSETLRRSQRKSVVKSAIDRPTVRNKKPKLRDAKETAVNEAAAKRKRGRPRKNEKDQPKKSKDPQPNVVEEEVNDDDDDEDDEETDGDKAHRKNRSKDYELKMRAIDENIAQFLKLHCDICQEEQVNFATLRRHMQQTHQCKAYAVCCNRKFRKRVYLADHVNRHLNPDYFKCNECDKVFADKQCKRNHFLIKHQPEEKKTFQCSQCPKKYAKGYLLEQHRVQHDERTHICDICERRFPSQPQLTSHIKSVHGQYGIMCDICAKVIRGRSAFARHQLEHSGVTLPKVQCNICGSWHKDKYSLQKHKRRHNEDGVKHECSYCGKVAPSRTALTSHQRNVHHAKRKHECSVCKKAFKKPISLKEHMTTHTGEVLYNCPHCPKTFNSNANMHSHRRKMHPVEFEETRRKRREQDALMIEQNKASLQKKAHTGPEAILLTIQTSDDESHNVLVTTGDDNDNEAHAKVSEISLNSESEYVETA